MNILRQYEENGIRITELTKDGETVSAIIKEEISKPVENVALQQKTTTEQIAEIKQDNLIIMDALATVFEEILNLQAMQGGI